MENTSDPLTIVALATPPGRGGMGVVRIAGPEAVRIAQQLARRRRPFVPRRATLVRLIDDADALVDRAIVTWFQEPHSYTGDDVVEISGHGSPVLMHRIVELAVGAGARLAEPGEFTLRAYLNGRLNLAQAEAVADLVNAVTPLQARAAMDQIEGTLTEEIGRIDAALFDLAARLEASLDFPEEGFHFVTSEEARSALGTIDSDLARLAADGHAGRLLREGCLVAIMGPPNAGKSSLFNAFVGAARAIVTDVPGTTRDLLTECVDLEGLAVTLVDTAGLRDSVEVIEAEGIARARSAGRVAALTLMTFDRSVPPDPDAARWIQEAHRPVIVVLNKSDRPSAWIDVTEALGATDVVEVSALSGAGLDDLRRRMATVLTGREPLRDPPSISNLRHLTLVETARAAVGRATEELLAGATEELALAELAAARRALEAVAGRRAPDAVLRQIFERFCVGK